LVVCQCEAEAEAELGVDVDVEVDVCYFEPNKLLMPWTVPVYDFVIILRSVSIELW